MVREGVGEDDADRKSGLSIASDALRDAENQALRAKDDPLATLYAIVSATEFGFDVSDMLESIAARWMPRGA